MLKNLACDIHTFNKLFDFGKFQCYGTDRLVGGESAHISQRLSRYGVAKAVDENKLANLRRSGVVR